ncbi:S1 family peptidase [Curtobacterium flaccumfaciens]|uniref:S1 family peptidase n=1 Tax=Curtobacterium flaccumfaciens TaxID=2035 RepID=UPI003995848E
MFKTTAPLVVGLEVRDRSGDVHIGTAFHIGDGFLVTAAHVLADHEITNVVLGAGVALSVIHSAFQSPLDDIALLSTNFTLNRDNFEGIELGGHLDDWIDDSFILQPTLMMGYPPIPMTRSGTLVASTGEVNAVVDRYDQRGAHFIISSTARGGFSGGPVLWGGVLLGVVTSSLQRHDVSAEPGYTAAISVEAVLDLLEKWSVAPRINRTQCYLLGQDQFRRNIDAAAGEPEREQLRTWYDDQLLQNEPSAASFSPTPPIIRGIPVWSAPLDPARSDSIEMTEDHPF